ncbi:MAG: hypothetical protein PVSMB8_16050 [Vulcanimicrobiaceae bacterium]
MKQLALVLAAVFFITAVLYWTGHGPFASPEPHAKHGIVSVVLGLLCLVWYRFQTATPAR